MRLLAIYVSNSHFSRTCANSAAPWGEVFAVREYVEEFRVVVQC